MDMYRSAHAKDARPECRAAATRWIERLGLTQANDGEARQTVGQVHLDGDRGRPNPHAGARVDDGE